MTADNQAAELQPLGAQRLYINEGRIVNMGTGLIPYFETANHNNYNSDGKLLLNLIESDFYNIAINKGFTPLRTFINERSYNPELDEFEEEYVETFYLI